MRNAAPLRSHHVARSEIERKKSWMRDDERFDLSRIDFDYAKK